MSSNLLSGIINPTDAGSLPQRFEDVRIGAQKQETQRITNELAGQILSETLDGKLGQASMARLNKINPGAGIEMTKQLRLQGDQELEFLAGATEAANGIMEGGGTAEDVSQYMATRAVLAQKMNMPELAQRFKASASAIKDPATQQETIRNLKISAQAFGGGKKKERAKFVGTPIRVVRDGQNFLTGIAQNASGGYERVDIPIEGDLLSTMGETGDDLTDRLIRQAR